MTEGSYLFHREVPISDKISISIPTVGEVLDNENAFYAELYMLTAMPIDYMVQLDDLGINFDEINEYDLFMLLFAEIQRNDTGMFFPGLDLKRFESAQHIQTGNIVLYDEADDIVIDRVIHTRIADTLRKIYGLEKDTRKPGNKEAREYMLKRARTKAKRRKNREQKSQLEQLIVAMVNTEQFKYGYEGTRELTMCQFNESVRQITKKIDFDHKMHGIYAGTVDPKSLSRDDLNWLIHS